jgi:nucleoside 2-deoxyribosyltransferase
MSAHVVGGTYWERCLEPDWSAMYGSGYRAASLLAAGGVDVTLTTRVGRHDEQSLRTYVASQPRMTLDLAVDDLPTMEFNYACPLDEPRIWPPHDGVVAVPMNAAGDVVLAFGMLDGRISYYADTAVWDPQSVFPLAPSSVGKSRRLAIVANAGQIRALGGSADLSIAMTRLAQAERADVVIAKNGLAGASVLHGGAEFRVPAYASTGAFSIGSGDVFSAVFTRVWALEGLSVEIAADIASRAVAAYTASQSLDGLDTQTMTKRQSAPIVPQPGRVYLAAPFFDLGQKALLDIAEHALKEAGMSVASPLRIVGRGPAADVAPADLALLASCAGVFAILTDRDVGTVFELGWAHDRGLHAVAYAPNLAEHQRTMLQGNGVQLFDDFSMAVVAAATA